MSLEQRMLRYSFRVQERRHLDLFEYLQVRTRDYKLDEQKWRVRQEEDEREGS